MQSMGRKTSLVALVAFLALAAPAAAYLPHGFIGISPQSGATASDYQLMEKSGVRSIRLLFDWAAIEPDGPSPLGANWKGYDHAVALAAEAGMRVFPVLYGTPEWVAASEKRLPVANPWQRWAWASFLRAMAGRYGLEGSFWEENPELPELPIHLWEIWNEENLVTFAEKPNPVEFASLLRTSGAVLHRADPRAQVIAGGLFGQPLQIPPNIGSGNFIARMYRAGGVKPYFDGIALHPYVGAPEAMGRQLANLRRVMSHYGDRRTPLYVTELGWGSDPGPTRWQRGLIGQADALSESFEMLSANRQLWGVRGVWWFTWSDEGGTCIFCTSAGLLTARREAKPAWYRFNEWTGGNPNTVPRAP
jgi:hypothetical protein